jgi:hypothetical protein
MLFIQKSARTRKHRKEKIGELESEISNYGLLSTTIKRVTWLRKSARRA